MTTATLTKPEKTTREDGISGYAVTMMNKEETSNREDVEIISHYTEDAVIVGIDRVVTLTATKKTNRVVVFSERKVEMITHDLEMEPGDSVILYPVNHSQDAEHYLEEN